MCALYGGEFARAPRQGSVHHLLEALAVKRLVQGRGAPEPLGQGRWSIARGEYDRYPALTEYIRDVIRGLSTHIDVENRRFNLSLVG